MKTIKIIFILGFWAASTLVGNVLAQETLPSFSFPDTSGQMQNVSQWRGKVLVINFWASWCQPCLKEIPEFVQLQTHYANQNVQFVGIAIDDGAAAIRFKERLAINYPILIASEWDGFNLSQQVGNSANTVPYTVVVNAEGQVVFRYGGAVKKDELVAAMVAAIKGH